MGTTMLKIIMLLVAPILFGQILFAQDSKSLQIKPLYLEYHSDENSKNDVIIRIRDQKSGSTARVNLQLQPQTPGIWYGYFSIQFIKGDEESKILEFLDKSGKKLFTFSESVGSTLNITLFPDTKKWTKLVAELQERKARAKVSAGSNSVSGAPGAPTAGPSTASGLGQNLARQAVTVEAPKAVVAPPPQPFPLPPVLPPVPPVVTPTFPDANTAAQSNGKSEKEKEAEQKKKVDAKKEEIRLEAKKAEEKRLSMEEEIAMKRERLRQEQESASAEDKRKRKDKALQLKNQADSAYKAGQYEAAEKLYGEASDLDSENTDFLYKYGVTLYKVGNYNKSLAILGFAEGEDVNSNEKAYYIALGHMKLKEYDKALKEFIELRAEDDPGLSPMASFFAGNIEFQTQKYPEARKSMEYTIDKSSDPQTDKAAEAMLEQIDKIESFMASMKEIFKYSANMGIIYDTNILNISKENLATDVSGYRINYGASFLYHWYRSYVTDFSSQIAMSDFYSMNKSFASDATLQATDPMELSINAPYKSQMQLGKKTYSFDFTPTYKSLYMAPTGGARSEILRTTSFVFEVTTAMSAVWISKFKIDYSMDKSLTTPATVDDDQNANKTTFSTSQIKLLNLKGTETLTGDISYLQNKADGKNNRYAKTSLGVTYGFPSFKESSGSLKLDYSMQPYSETAAARTDKVWSVTYAASKNLNKATSFSLSGQYSNSTSDQPTYTYDKYMITTMLTYTGSVQSK